MDETTTLVLRCIAANLNLIASRMPSRCDADAEEHLIELEKLAGQMQMFALETLRRHDRRVSDVDTRGKN